MKPKKFPRKRIHRKSIQPLCGEIQADDGLDPREFFRPSRGCAADNRKARQLCGQVGDTLSLVLAGECGDDVLRNLQVIAVTPAPDSSQLLVLVGPAAGGQPADRAEVLARLSAAAGRLRSEVAAAITRRRAPALLFDYLPGDLRAEVRS